ncbi:MAG TPA: molybdopterin dinucleotide binding domain-containing protein [Pyrinomonadaceae bacterium]|nr:molybdopterin dinucleotide binding domain-containing protein [Pyrinomonadaceae bacterium]
MAPQQRKASQLIQATINNQAREFDEGADRLNLQNGERVRVRSAYGEAVLPLRITSSVKAGELFATFHTAEVFLNRVTSPLRDRCVKTPEYKITAVHIEKV